MVFSPNSFFFFKNTAFHLSSSLIYTLLYPIRGNSHLLRVSADSHISGLPVWKIHHYSDVTLLISMKQVHLP